MHSGVLNTDSEKSTSEPKYYEVKGADKESLLEEVEKLVAHYSETSTDAILNPPGENNCVSVLNDEAVVGRVVPSEQAESNDKKAFPF